MSARDKSKETLEESHSFPCDYAFKVIGDNSEEFVARVVQVGVNVVGSEANPDVSTRESSGGKYVSVTIEMEMADAETILEVYEGFQAMDNVRFIL